MSDNITPFVLTLNLQGLYAEIEGNFYDLLKMQKFDQAILSWQKLYSEFIISQTKNKRRLHKGGILHNLGITYFYSKDIQNAFKYFVLAYAEDLAAQEEGYSGPAEEGPAAKNLKSLYKIQDETLEIVKKTVKESILKKDKKYWDPKQLFSKFFETDFDSTQNKENVSRLRKEPLIEHTHTINSIPGNWNKRVFVGGNYTEGRINNVLEIKKVVRSKGYTPIVDLEFTDTEPDIHDHALLLLHNCKYAIFDITDDSGYLMEVERTLDYRTETLLVYEDMPGAHMSAMIKTMGRKMYKFSTKESLKDLVENFLP